MIVEANFSPGPCNIFKCLSDLGPSQTNSFVASTRSRVSHEQDIYCSTDLRVSHPPPLAASMTSSDSTMIEQFLCPIKISETRSFRSLGNWMLTHCFTGHCRSRDTDASLGVACQATAAVRRRVAMIKFVATLLQRRKLATGPVKGGI